MPNKINLSEDALFAKTYNFISYRLRSTKEVTEYLVRFGKDKTVVQIVLERLVALDLLSDEKFAQAWVRDRLKYHPKGKIALRLELKQKGITSEIIEKALAENVGDELEMARNLLSKKLKQWQDLPILTQKRRAYGLLARHGFSAQTTSCLVDALGVTEYNN